MVKPVMIKTAASHALVAVVIQLVLWPLVGLAGGGTAGVAFYLGREITQHEYKGGSWEKDLPPSYGFIHHWSLDSVLDMAAPVAACGAVYAAAWYAGVRL